MTVLEKMRVGVVVERREIESRWTDYTWEPVSVVPGAPPLKDPNKWVPLRAGDSWEHFLIGTLEIELFRRETEGYRANMSNSPPHVYVVLTKGTEADEPEIVPFLVTVCPYEAESYTEGDEEIVEGVPMPEEVASWVQKFIDDYHVEEPFKKRKNKKAYDPSKGDFTRRSTIIREVKGGGGG